MAGSDREQAPAAAEAGDLGILKGLLEGQGVTGALDHSKIEGGFWAGRLGLKTSKTQKTAACIGAGPEVDICT